MPEVESLLVSIAADTSNLVKGLRDAEGSLGRFAAAAETVATSIKGFIGIDIIQRLATFAEHSLESTAALGRLADQAGLSVQQFQGLEAALRESGVEGDAMAQAFGRFSRNLSDIQRNTGPFLEFLRRSAPQFVENFKAAKDVSDAFDVLTDVVNQLADRQDRLRVLTEAGGREFGRFANSMLQGRTAIDSTRDSFQGLTDAQVKAAQDIERRWSNLWRNIELAAKQAIVGPGEVDPGHQFEENAQRILQLQKQLANNPFDLQRFEKQAELNRLLREQVQLLGQAFAESDKHAAMPAPDTHLLVDPIKAAQGQLALYMQQLQALPPQAELISTAFQNAFGKQAEVMRATGETEAAISAARIAMLRQEDAERLRVLGNAIQPYDELIRRQNDLNFALETGLIDSEQFARAMAMASATMRDSYLSATSAVGQAVAKVFDGNKSVAVAAAIIDTLAAANKALAAPPGPPVSFAYVAAALATGYANVRAILNTTKTSTATPGGGGAGATSTTPAPFVQQQSLYIQGVDPAMWYSGRQLESFIAGLNDATKNGQTLISTRNIAT
jgi:hypothetical protein